MNFNRSQAPKVVAGLTASTTQTQGQGAITATDAQLSVIAEVATCANANDTVTAPTVVVGRTFTIVNNGASALRVYPSTGANLGAGVNTAVTVAAGAVSVFSAYAPLKWKKIN